MNIIDVVIILLILMGAVVGFKRGFTKQVITFIGFLLVVVLAFALKNPLSNVLYTYLPFFNFSGALQGVTVLNIVLYEFLSFVIVLALLSIVLRVLIFASSVFEKILNFTIILGIPSKILGAIVGVMEYFILVFIGLYFLTLPIFNIDIINESKYANSILQSTPILSSMVENSVNVMNDFKELKDKYAVLDDVNGFNYETLNLFLKYDVITVDATDKLVNNGKLTISGAEDLIDQYRINE